METYTKRKILTIDKEDSSMEVVKITSSKSAETFARKFYHADMELYESFFLILLNRNNETIGYAKISQGGVAGTVVDPKIVAKFAIETLSSSVVLVHNHPSGNIQPSQNDKELTTKIVSGLLLFDIQVLDHIILTSDKSYSFMDNNLI